MEETINLLKNYPQIRIFKLNLNYDYKYDESTTNRLVDGFATLIQVLNLHTLIFTGKLLIIESEKFLKFLGFVKAEVR